MILENIFTQHANLKNTYNLTLFFNLELIITIICEIISNHFVSQFKVDLVSSYQYVSYHYFQTSIQFLLEIQNIFLNHSLFCLHYHVSLLQVVIFYTIDILNIGLINTWSKFHHHLVFYCILFSIASTKLHKVRSCCACVWWSVHYEFVRI